MINNIGKQNPVYKLTSHLCSFSPSFFPREENKHNFKKSPPYRNWRILMPSVSIVNIVWTFLPLWNSFKVSLYSNRSTVFYKCSMTLQKSTFLIWRHRVWNIFAYNVCFLLILSIYYIDSLYSYLSPWSNDLEYSIILMKSERKFSCVSLYPWHLAQYMEYSRHSLIKWVKFLAVKWDGMQLFPVAHSNKKWIFILYTFSLLVLEQFFQSGVSAAFHLGDILLPNT